MVKRRIAIASSIGGASLLAGYLLRPGPLEPGVSVENFRRLHAGMTYEQVESLLGRPHVTERQEKEGLFNKHMGWGYWKVEGLGKEPEDLRAVLFFNPD